MAKAKRPTRRTASTRVDVFALARQHRLAPIADATAAEGSLELAWDGHRVLACALGRAVRLVSADHRDWADRFPTIVAAVLRLARRDVVVEGFLCALGPDGRPSFDLLREHVGEGAQRIVLACIDLHRLDGEDVRVIPAAERRARLAALLAAETELVFSEALEGPLAAVLEGARQLGARGLLVRRADGELVAVSTSDEPVRLDRSLSAAPRRTNLDKILYPRDGYTKKEIFRYYEELAPVLLPYLRDRPLVGQRWPDGIDDFTWYQHRMPPRAPDYLRAVWIEGNRRIVAESHDAIVWLANQAVLTFHGWASRCATLSAPDWVILDLDPGAGTTFADVVKVATTLRRLLELLDLPSVPKTSGQKGLHVLVPIGPGHTTLQANEVARRIGLLLAQALPGLVTTNVGPELRRGKILVDTLQSYVGKMLVLPYSLRAADGAPVSAPLAWDEVNAKLDPRALNLATVRRRLDARGDLAAPLLAGTAQLAPALARLEG